MTYYFKITIIACLFIFLVHTEALRTQQLDMKADTEKFDFNDLTKGLSDAEIESALSDLTLADLNVLSKLIDEPNAADYNYEEEGYYLGNGQRDLPFDDMQIDNNVNENDYDDAEEQLIREPRTALRFKLPRNTLTLAEQTANLRPKRENPHASQQISVDEEYLKQLENSFPRDQEQNNHEEFDDKKDHVRVKRN